MNRGIESADAKSVVCKMASILFRPPCVYNVVCPMGHGCPGIGTENRELSWYQLCRQRRQSWHHDNSWFSRRVCQNRSHHLSPSHPWLDICNSFVQLTRYSLICHGNNGKMRGKCLYINIVHLTRKHLYTPLWNLHPVICEWLNTV